MIFDGKMMGFVPTRDAARARTFYEGVLGMGVVSIDGFAVVLDGGGSQIRLVTVGEFTPARFTVLGWQVLGIEATVKELAEAGVVFEQYGLPGQDADGIWSTPGAKVAWFKDPDGNVLSISQHE